MENVWHHLSQTGNPLDDKFLPLLRGFLSCSRRCWIGLQIGLKQSCSALPHFVFQGGKKVRAVSKSPIELLLSLWVGHAASAETQRQARKTAYYWRCKLTNNVDTAWLSPLLLFYHNRYCYPACSTLHRRRLRRFLSCWYGTLTYQHTCFFPILFLYRDLCRHHMPACLPVSQLSCPLFSRHRA